MLKKLISRAVAVLLVLASLNQYVGVALAQEHLNNLYVSEISVGSRQELESEGFIVTDENLNEGGTPAYIGYKLTDDADEAITDVSVLGMYGHYAPMTYQKTLLNDSESVIEMGMMLQTATEAFAEKYKRGSPFAELAYDILNARTIPDDTGREVPLGEYLVSSARDLEDFKKIGLISSNVGIAYIINQLCLGAADDTTSGENSWMERLCENGPLDFTDEETGEPLDDGEIEDIYAQEYDGAYLQRAQRLYVAVSAFAGDYEEAVDRSGSIEELDVSEEEAEEAAEDAADAITGGTTLEFDSDVEVSGEEAGDMLPLALYALLDERDEEDNPVYPFGAHEDGTLRTLAEYFIEVGSMEDDEDAWRALYPLLVEQDGDAPLNEGQEVLMYLSGLSNMISTAASDEDSLEEARSRAEEQIEELLDLNDGEALSIWYDVNTEIYDECQEGVFWTSELAREAAAGNRYDLLTKPVGAKGLTFDQKLKNAAIYTGCVAIAALGAVYIAVKILSKLAIAYSVGTIIGEFVTFATTSIAYTTGAIIGLALGTVFIAVAVLAVVALIIIGLIWLFKWLFEDDDDPELEMEEMPRVMYDYVDDGEGSATIYYSVNTVGSDTPANLNDGNRNTPWVVLYYSKDPLLGEPLTAEMDAEQMVVSPFVVQKESQVVPEGYSPVSFFEALTAANLNEYRSGVTGVFAFFHRLGGIVPQREKQGQYLAALKLFSASGKGREEAAKSQAVIEGFNLIDFNLTSDGYIASYVGYKTTDDETKALTDIRVAYSTGMDPDGATLTYGGAEYACYGNAGDLLLMATKYECAGSPILASDIVVTSTLGNAPAGYEPVNLFCGGPAFDFNNCNGWAFEDPDDMSESDIKESSSGWKNHAFIYFHPSVTYTSGTEYLGGLAFFSGEPTEYMTEMGWTPLTNWNLNADPGADSDITYDLSGVQDGRTILCYSVTYNPKRAIYDIQYFGAESSTQALPANLSLSSGGSVPCEVFQQGGGSVGNNRMLRISHAYRSSIWFEGGGKYGYSECIDDQTQIWEKFTKDVPYVEWYDVNGSAAASNIRCAALYVVGNRVVKGVTNEPIRISELLVSPSAEYEADEWTPVRSITDSYSSEGANLAFNDLYHSGNLYLYINRPDPYAALPKYVASVHVACVKGKDMDEDNGSVNPHDTAAFMLVGNGAGRLLNVDLTGVQNWDERIDSYTHSYVPDYPSEYALERDQKVNVLSHDSDYAAALVWVTYTNVKTAAVSDIVIYESADGKVPDIVKTADGATTTSCGDGFQVNGKGTTYFLRSVYNSGNPITDLQIDKDIMKRDYWTSLSTTGKASTYDRNYIKTKHFRKATLTYFISGIYTAEGATEKEALMDLLGQGCRYFCPFNLSTGKGRYLYIGYSLSTSYKNAFSGLILHDGGQDNEIDTIKTGYDTYVRVTDSLNSGVYDALIKMYVTSSARKACEMGADRASKGHYITDIMFFNSKDLNDYATGKKDLSELDAATRAYVEGYIFDDDKEPVYWDIVTNSSRKVINCNITALEGGVLNTSVPEVYMYIHYSDNATPYYDTLTGSVFSQNPTLLIVVCSVSVLGLMAAAYLVLRKRKSALKHPSAPLIEKEESK